MATILSAQTTDKKVNEVTPALFAEARDDAAVQQRLSSRALTVAFSVLLTAIGVWLIAG